jgi:hypothetical protein
MTPQGATRIWWDTSIQAYRLVSPFNKSLVDAFKLLVPASDRQFDPQSKIWTFTERWLTPTLAMFKQIGLQQPTVVSRADAERASAGSQSQSHSVTHTTSLDKTLSDFVRLLPFEAAQSAYRKASLVLHPDRGGDMDKMQALNNAWQKIERELYKQGV